MRRVEILFCNSLFSHYNLRAFYIIYSSAYPDLAMSNHELFATAPLTDQAGIVDWLKAFSAAVRAHDYDAGKQLFAPEAMGFGTYGDRLDGLETLVDQQWHTIWEITRGYDFDYETIELGVNEHLGWAAATWTSQKQDDQGVWQTRPGRATFIFEKRDGQWLAVHSHHSLHPTLLRAGCSQPQ